MTEKCLSKQDQESRCDDKKFFLYALYLKIAVRGGDCQVFFSRCQFFANFFYIDSFSHFRMCATTIPVTKPAARLLARVMPRIMAATKKSLRAFKSIYDIEKTNAEKQPHGI